MDLEMSKLAECKTKGSGGACGKPETDAMPKSRETATEL